MSVTLKHGCGDGEPKGGNPNAYIKSMKGDVEMIRAVLTAITSIRPSSE